MGLVFFFLLVFHVCGLEARKQAQINAPGKLPKDRAVPRGEDAAAVKGYINILKPSPAGRNNLSSFPCCCKKVASGWDGERRGRSLGSLALMPHATAGCPPPWRGGDPGSILAPVAQKAAKVGQPRAREQKFPRTGILPLI